MSQCYNAIYADDGCLGNLADVTSNHCTYPFEGDKADIFEIHLLFQEETNKCGSHKLNYKVKIADEQ
ncbi:hypothetical protein ANCCAN_28788 [Ancylostoma caninum]|uniref:Uncharacterized protein n=1 Tax=Ancylostoma caninum TaxID=29170 RepID=A0A368F3A8_ANCCA|nr:hypothetical protein ANCCAN_28788 [Ancylostoma caninum]